jgi:hypothetical protein
MGSGVFGMNQERRSSQPAQFLCRLRSIESRESIEEFGRWGGDSWELIVMSRRIAASMPIRQ